LIRRPDPSKEKDDEVLRPNLRAADGPPRAAFHVLEFTGGSGRFSDATGTADFEATTPDGLHVAISFAGLIGYLE
jgi:hypothetical protein